MIYLYVKWWRNGAASTHFYRLVLGSSIVIIMVLFTYVLTLRSKCCLVWELVERREMWYFYILYCCAGSHVLHTNRCVVSLKLVSVSSITILCSLFTFAPLFVDVLNSFTADDACGVFDYLGHPSSTAKVQKLSCQYPSSQHVIGFTSHYHSHMSVIGPWWCKIGANATISKTIDSLFIQASVL